MPVPLTDEQVAYEKVPIPFTPVRRLERGRLYVRKRTLPHQIYGYSQAHDVYSVVDLAGFKKGYEPRSEILGVYTPNPQDTFRLQNGHLPPYQPTTTGDKLQEAMANLPTYEAWRIAPAVNTQTRQTRTAYYAQAWLGETLESSTPDYEVERPTIEETRRDMERWKQNPKVLAIELYKGKQEFIEDVEAGRAGGYWQLAEFEEWEPVESWQRPGLQAQTRATTAVDYWNAHLEHNPLRVNVGETLGGTEVSWVLEAAGDILREYEGTSPASDYITEKVRRIEKESFVREWLNPISPRDQSLIDETKKRLEGLPAPTPFHQDLKKVMKAILDRKPAIIRLYLDRVKEHLRGNNLLYDYVLETREKQPATLGSWEESRRKQAELMKKYAEEDEVERQRIIQGGGSFVFIDGTLENSLKKAGEHVGMTMDTLPDALDLLKLEWPTPRVASIYPDVFHRIREWDIYWADQDENFVKELSVTDRQEFEQGIRSWLKEWRGAKTKRIWPATNVLPQTLMGTCYQDAWRFVIREEEGELVHGSVYSGGRRLNHAWVETMTGWVWEPETKQYIPKANFYYTYAPIVEARYTPEQAAIMAARTMNNGPWTAEERRLYLSEKTSAETYSLSPSPAIISQYPTGSMTISHGTTTLTGRFQRKGEMKPGQIEPDIEVTVIKHGNEEDFQAGMKKLEEALRANIRQVEDSEQIERIEPTIRVTVPEERAKYPLILSMDDFKKDWEPKGWKIIFIGPTSTWRQEWGIWEAIRDLVQNALDETETYQWGYDDEGLWLADKGKGVAIADFLLGPPKLKSEYARGRFGEGMKISCLALLRSGYNVHIETVDRELWMIFIEQEADGKVQSLAAMWKPGGTTRGTKFHILGYFGESYEDRFVVNLPKSSIVAQGPALVNKPFQRYNQLIQHEFLEGNRIYARDIFMRPINSVFSYNLWGFEMAPDRFGPRKEDDVWVDMGRLWSCIKDVKLLEIFFQMKCDPPFLTTDETHKLVMFEYQMGINPETNVGYREEIRKNKAVWLQAWKNTFGEDAVLRTNADWDAIVKHLGYKSVSLAHGVTPTLTDVIPYDRKLIDESQERLREVKVVPDEQLSPGQLAHLSLARAIVSRVSYGESLGGVRAAIIPPASDRVRTAGMYGRSTREIFIHIEQLFRGSTTVDTVIHEVAHHNSGAEDGEEAHNLEMTRVAGDVVSLAASKAFDDLVKAPGFRW
jgi:hypothetical protein